MKKGKGLVCLVAAMVFMTACGRQTAKKTETKEKQAPQEITLGIQGEIVSMDSTLSSDTYGVDALNNVMEGLYRLTKDNKLELAGAAKLPEISSDQRTYTIALNKKAKWSNGEPVTANDYVFAWRKAVNPKTAAEYSYLFNSIENAEAIIAGKMPVTKLGIRAVNTYTVEIKLAQATPYFKSLLAFPTFFPQNEKFVTTQGENYAKTSKNLLYNGPFVLKDFEGAGADEEWTYVKNNQYWHKNIVKLSKISNQVVKESSTGVNLFENGQIDDVLLTGELAKQYKENKAFISLEKAGTTYLSYNQTKKTYQNKKVRQAISLVLDRPSIVEQILGDGSLAPTGLVPSGMSVSPKDGQDFAKEAGNQVKTDVPQAKKLWKEAKTELGISTLTIELLAYDTDAIKKVAEYVQSAVEENLEGAKVTVSVVPVSVAVERGKSANFDLFLFGWSADYADPSTFLDLMVSNSPYNYGRYKNAAYDKLIKAASTENITNPEKRWTNFIDAQRLLMKDVAVAPLIQKAEARLRNPKLKGVVAHSTGAQFDFKQAYVAK